MLTLTVPNSAHEVYSYTGRVLFEEILGISVSVRSHDLDIVLVSNSKDDKVIQLNAEFAGLVRFKWGNERSMPKIPLKWVELPAGVSLPDERVRFMPVIYGIPELRCDEKRAVCGIDILGSCFFMLSRYEEFCSDHTDAHGRFPTAEMLAVRENFITRPIVNEYAELLWHLIRSYWPKTYRNTRSYRFLLSCDVDHETDPSIELFQRILRRFISRILVNRNIPLAFSDLSIYLKKKIGFPCRDNYQENLSWMIRENARLGCRTTFNFIPINTHYKFDPSRKEQDANTQKTLIEISKAGHLVGFHPGYEANKNNTFQISWRVFQSKIKEAEIEQTEIGGRHHYLRFKIGFSEKLWQDAGLSYDSSLGFTEIAGFRAGICHEYTMFDLSSMRSTSLMQRPLILMDHAINTVHGVREKTFQDIQRIIKTCKFYSGDFTLLWHNSSFSYPQSRNLYLALIREAITRGSDAT